MHIYMYLCVYISTCVYIYIYMYIHIYIYVYMYMYYSVLQCVIAFHFVVANLKIKLCLNWSLHRVYRHGLCECQASGPTCLCVVFSHAVTPRWDWELLIEAQSRRDLLNQVFPLSDSCFAGRWWTSPDGAIPCSFLFCLFVWLNKTWIVKPLGRFNLWSLSFT